MDWPRRFELHEYDLATTENRLQTAFIYDSPVTHQIKHITYGSLLEQVSSFAGVLRHFGVNKGDAVAIYMPMVRDNVVADVD